MGISAAVAGAGALLGAGASAYGASQASNAQQKAAKLASQTQLSMFNQTQKNLSPFMQFGADAAGQLGGKLAGLTTPFNPTMEQLAATPGYQFTLQQGMNAVNNSNSALGWGDSGPGAKGIADYAAGLASQTYQQQYNNYWNQNKSIYDMLMGPTQLGENAAAQQGSFATALGGQLGSNIIGAGNAQAAGDIGMANAAGSIPTNMLMMYSMLGGNGSSGNMNPLYSGNYGSSGAYSGNTPGPNWWGF